MLKLELLFLASLFVCVYTAPPQWKCANPDWLKYKEKFDKTYTSAEIELSHFNTYCDNIIRINQHNERFLVKDEKYALEVDKFTDLNPKQVAALLKNRRKNRPINRPSRIIPVEYDDTDQ